MRKLTIIAAVLAASTPAHASQAMKAYVECWTKVVSTLSVNEDGPAKDHETDRLARLADKVCGPQSRVAAKVDAS